MYHGTWAQVATVAAVFVALGSMSFAGGALSSLSGAHGAAGPSSHAAVAPGFVPRPHAVPWNSSINITSTYSGTQQLPLVVTYTLNVTGAPLNAANDSVSLSIWSGSNLVANLSQPVMTNVTSYSVTVGYGDLLANNYNGGVLPSTPYGFIGWLTANNTTAYNSTLNAPLATTVESATVLATIAITNLAATISAPGAFEPTGYVLNYTFAATGSSGIVNDTNNITLAFDITYHSNGMSLNSTLTAPPATYQPGTPVPMSGTISLGSNYAPLSGEYLFTLWVTAQNSLTGAQARTVGPSGHVTMALGTPATTILSPANGTSFLSGEINISVVYTGDYGSSATITVFNSVGTAVFALGVFQPGLGAHAGVATWPATTPGKYLIEFNVTSPYEGTVASWSNLTILAAPPPAAGATIYYNTTQYNNATATNAKLFGLTPGAASALLLVAGLIIGLIVALALGKMMWGSSTPAGAQPWKAAGKNECSVCHQSFDTAEQLKEHAKDAHGMG
ncbi:MAG: hypothetical protein L3K11_08570 [Thermoplasmata archaeon]|nr:hypothetical protein [Thermoplasmata archaeon]